MKRSNFHIFISALIIALSLLIISLLQSCSGRKDVLHLASITKDKIPQIILYDPADNIVDAPLNAKICVVFSRPMNIESVESSFSYSYDNKVFGSESGSFNWSDDNTGFIFSPSTELPKNSTISVIITDKAKSTEGINIPDDLLWSFNTSDNSDLTQPNVISVDPVNGSLNNVNQTISITFDEPMLKGTVEMAFYLQSTDGSDTRDNNNGYFEWDENVATYYPDEPLNEGDLYYIYLDKDGIIPKDLAGNELASYTASNFYTESDELYVSVSGDDTSNYGNNRYSPFQTIGRAVDCAKGDAQYSVINIDHSNNYNESIYLNSSEYNGLIIKGGWNTNFTQQDGITKISDSTNDFVVEINDCNDITLENLEIDSSTSTTTNLNGAISVDTCQNVVLNNLTLKASTSSGSSTYGLYIDDSSVAVNNCFINGGASTTENCGVYLIGSSDQTIIKNSIITGGSAGIVYGIYIDGCAPTIESNQSISAGSTSSNPSYGIFINNSASPIIRDNHLIYGGDNNVGDTYSIYATGTGSSADIYRNIIVGGNESNGSQLNYGIYYANIVSSNLYNNFIIGGSFSTNQNNDCIGIYINGSDVNIINNTIDGGGNQSSNSHRSVGIYALTENNSLLINNIIMGGNGNNARNLYGIELANASNISIDIINNIFDQEKCSDAYLRDNLGVSYTAITAMQSNYSTASDNLKYTTSDGVTYSDEQHYDYHISTDDSNLIKNHGFNSNNADFSSYSDIYNDPAALYDIDKEARPTDYSKIDLGADEFAP